MPIRISIALLTFLLVAGTQLRAQDQPASTDASVPIATDRPSFTNSSVVVPSGSIQAEDGFLETANQGRSVFDAPETLLRFGVAARTELRFTAPNYFYNMNSAAGRGLGFSDFSIGVKEQLGPTLGGFDVSATLFLSLPSGARSVSSGGYDPGLQVAWSRSLSARWTAGGMFSLYWPTQVNMRNLTGESTFLLDRQLTGPWDPFVESVSDFPERGGTRQTLHFGTTLKIAKRHQLDFGVGLSSAAADHFIGIGYSFWFTGFRLQPS